MEAFLLSILSCPLLLLIHSVNFAFIGLAWTVQPTATQPIEIRLVNGTSRCVGRLEVFHNGLWGTVCDDSWGIEDARVVCRQLGCASAILALRDSHFGRGTGRIWMDEVRCVGTESFLNQCPSRPWGDNDCHHGEDAGVVCSGEFVN